MSTTTGINGSSTLSTQGTTLTPQTDGLGENDFLMLMMAQLQNQDPLNPADPTQFMSELAQFSSLEQQNSIATSTSAQASQGAMTAALALLGHTVTYTDANGDAQSGTVSKVEFDASGPTLTIGASSGIPFSSVTEAQ